MTRCATAYRKAMEDPELQAKAAKLERPLEPAYGEDVARMVKAALTQPPETIALLKEALEPPKEAAPRDKGRGCRMGRPQQDRAQARRRQDLRGVCFRLTHRNQRRRTERRTRSPLKVGMTCSIDGPSGGEAKSISCN